MPTSPCGRYEVVLKPLPDGHTEITVKSNAVLLTIDRDSEFVGDFFTRNGQVWFWTGRHSQHQILVNLETNQQYESKNQPHWSDFMWVEVDISSSGNILSVGGCAFGHSPHVRFFDLSNPEAGWPEIECDQFLPVENAGSFWQDDVYVHSIDLPWNEQFNKPAYQLSPEESQGKLNVPDKEICIWQAVLEFKGKMVLKSFFKDETKLALVGEDWWE